MVFILSSDGRDDDAEGAFRRYADYLQSVKADFPPSAFQLATSGWYFGFGGHSPHDATLEAFEFAELPAPDAYRGSLLLLKVRLRAAYEEGQMELLYPEVFAYTLAAPDVVCGHFDWRYDELRLSERGHLIHEIEWSGVGSHAHWLIEASDLELRWIPARPA
jgi:hypothetical protein